MLSRLLSHPTCSRCAASALVRAHCMRRRGKTNKQPIATSRTISTETESEHQQVQNKPFQVVCHIVFIQACRPATSLMIANPWTQEPNPIISKTNLRRQVVMSSPFES